MPEGVWCVEKLLEGDVTLEQTKFMRVLSVAASRGAAISSKTIDTLKPALDSRPNAV